MRSLLIDSKIHTPICQECGQLPLDGVIRAPGNARSDVLGGYTGREPGSVFPGIPLKLTEPVTLAAGSTYSPASGALVGGSGRRQHLPAGHRFFPDPEREVTARAISWAMGLGQDALFLTLTHKDFVTPTRNDKMVHRLLARLEQSLKDSGSSQLKSTAKGRSNLERQPTPQSLAPLSGGGSHGLKSICATEWQQREVIHDHLVLIGHGLGNLSRKRIESRWTALGGGYARCYEADAKAAPYLAKYTSKRLGGEVQWDGDWQGLRFPASVSRVQVGASSDAGQGQVHTRP